ncbi:MAG: hypothetical protein FVQ80_02665 [Planctomycetes bacterium]|nr:hypothetical protein [Planctomycetota bacterium]
MSGRMHRPLAAVLIVCLCGLCFGVDIKVDADATGGNDGTSWSDAYTQLQSAFAAAGSGDKILVAAGTYKPDYDVNSSTHTGDRMATFQLINGVSVKGGYAGFSEPIPSCRDIKLYETILTGDIGIADSNSDNSYHVVTGSGTDANAVLDGFTITQGYADEAVNDGRGGGMYNFSGSPTVKNCTFVENYASAMGGGMFNQLSAPMITNCTFIRNRSK